MGDDVPHIALTPRMQRTIRNAARIAAERGHDWVGTEHLLLALLDDPGGIAGSGIRLLGFEPALRAMGEGALVGEGSDTPGNVQP